MAWPNIDARRAAVLEAMKTGPRVGTGRFPVHELAARFQCSIGAIYADARLLEEQAGPSNAAEREHYLRHYLKRGVEIPHDAVARIATWFKVPTEVIAGDLLRVKADLQAAEREAAPKTKPKASGRRGRALPNMAERRAAVFELMLAGVEIRGAVVKDLARRFQCSPTAIYLDARSEGAPSKSDVLVAQARAVACDLEREGVVFDPAELGAAFEIEMDQQPGAW